MTFRHLANMVSGYALPEAPGEAWGYNDYAISLYVKTLFDRVFQQTPNQAANNANRLQPLKFQDGNIFGSKNGYGLYTTPRDYARIGWLWLNKGYWNGRQLLPSSYFDEYFVPQVPSDMPRTIGGTIDDYLDVGTYGGGTNETSKGPGVYGFNLWHNRGRLLWPDIPEDVYQANGHWNGEVLTVLPSQNMVVAWKGNSASSNGFPLEMNSLLKILIDANIP
jgi:CubicO group peptidase (beta-lactamase class C family)